MYEQETRGIRVSVIPNYLENQSDPEDGRFVWSYTVRIDNDSQEVVQLRTRYWRIIDCTNWILSCLDGQKSEIRRLEQLTFWELGH